MTMKVYLHDVPLDEARSRFNQALSAAHLDGLLGEEELPLDEFLLGRVLSRAIWAKISSPHYHAAAMDGFVVRAKDTAGAMPNYPLILKLGTQAAYVDTGDPIPAWADAVIPIENVEPLDEGNRPSIDARKPVAIRIRSSVTPWSHIRPMGEDIVATQLVIPAGQQLRPVDLGAIAAGGNTSAWVARKPQVAIIPTGSELVSIGSPLEAGDIIEYNSLVLAAQVREWGGEAIRHSIVPDDFSDITAQVKLAAEVSDLVLLNAGSSAGSEDFSARVIEELGDLLVHGVAVRPGHPVILGMIRQDSKPSQSGSDQPRTVPIIGVPGYPVSAALTFEIFVEPLLRQWLGQRPYERNLITAQLTRKITSPPGDEDYVRVALGRVGGKILAAPLSRGAGVITSLVRADGIAILPRGSQGLLAGSEVQVRMYRSMAEIDRTILAVGSHDIALDLLAQYLAGFDRRLASANVGSLGGLVAIKRGETHLAGSHLLDPQTGEYNLSYILQYLPGRAVIIISLVKRQQGLLVEPGNPKSISGIKDLTREDIQFINRQRGAGTRLLLDYHLDQEGIAANEIRGYNQEEYTHLGVAAAIASGRANCGLGIAAAARGLNLDFIPLYEERYDLVIPAEYYQSELLEPLFVVLANPEFRQVVSQLPGYDSGCMGELVAELP
jgi:molybdopterin molybdotransferase/putative molybdopterin biosynthesis protein